MPRIRREKKPQGKMEPFWSIGLYIRLSKEDENEDESESVINQEKILRDFVAGHFEPGTYTITDVFADDGLTGTNTSRPEFKRLEARIVRGEVNCMIIKSLARGFRNLADQQKFLEEFIPLHGTRFISIGRPFIDTYANPRETYGFEVPIQGMFNEQFAAATSEEVRKTFDMKRARGEFIGSFAPYGYKKDPDNKNHLLIDDEAAEVIRCIYSWFLNDGLSKRAIAKKLSGMGEPNPEAYKKRKGMKYRHPQSGTNDGLWSARTVHTILQNLVYTGTMVQGRNRIISYKLKTQIAVPEEEWFVVEDTHEAIIDREIFAKAQALHRRDTRTAPGGDAVHTLSGFVRCADCQKALHRKSAKGIHYYHCRTFADKQACTKHSIRQDVLENAVLTALQMQIALADSLSEEIERINKAPVVRRESERLSHALEQAQKQLRQQADLFDGLYMDWKNGDITQDEYRRLKGKLTGQMTQLEKTITHLQGEIRSMEKGIGADDPYLAAFLKNRNIRTLSRGIVVELIDVVWVHESGEVTVDFNFADRYQRAADYVENNHGNLVLTDGRVAV